MTPGAESVNGETREGAPRDFRRRFILGGLGLILIAGLLMGMASAFIVGRELLRELDRDLDDTARRLASSLEIPGPDGRLGPGSRLDRPGFDVGTLIAVVGPQVTEGAYIGPDGQLRVLDTEDLSQFRSATWLVGEPQTIHLDAGLREVRATLVGQVGESQLLVGLPMNEIRQTIARLTVVVFLVVGSVVAVAALIGMWGLRVALRPLDRMRETAHTISEQSFDQRDSRLIERVPDHLANPRTEIGQLGASFNHMLDHIDQALVARARSEDKVRQFVSDASHELRTPLASIRGYSEITLQHEKKLPQPVRSSLARIEAESIRMSHLVDDLLLLARLDEGERGQAVAVNMSDVATDVVADASVRWPEHTFEVVGATEPHLVTGDRDQLVQMLTNLTQNAAVHTLQGTTVTITVDSDESNVTLRVEDDGPGIPAAIRDTLFERFRRADKGRSRASGSTGLGLAIVSSIVGAHGGTIDVESTPGQTEFRVRLPRRSTS